jgi:hypothetical protein
MTEQNTPRLRRLLVSLAKKPSTAFSQEDDVGVKWKVHRGWRASHSLTFGCLWVVDDGMNRLALCHGGLGRIEETDELLMAVPLHATADHRAVQHVEGSKQGRRVIALIVVGDCTAAAFFIGKPDWVWSSA